MAEIRRTALFGKLDDLALRSLDSATALCRQRGNPYVELAHWLQLMLSQPDSDLHRIVRHFGIDASRLARDVVAALDRLPRGATAVTDLSDHIDEAVERGWLYGSILYGASRVRTGHLLVGMFKSPALRRVLAGISRELDRVSLEALSDDFSRIVAGSPEEAAATAAGGAIGAAAQGAEAGAEAEAAAGGEAPGALAARREALARFAVDLTARARRGEIDPVTGRDQEIRQIVDILMRRRQNNPILTGEAGVGKTAVVEGFALRIARGDVPPALREVTLMTLDIGLLQAGASVRGEFEARLRQVIDEVQASPRPIILFIDEAHMLIGAGGAAGTSDAANLLKPALARGTLRTVAATTWAEYKRYFERDPALTRRFQVVQIQEPGEDRAVLMVRGVASTLERYHRVQLLDEALVAGVRLSHRYIPARQLPDKAVSLLDTACARVAISQHATPPAVEDCRRRIESLQTELEIVGREQASGIDTAERGARARAKLEAERARLVGLEERWSEERSLVDAVLRLRARLRGEGQPADRPAGAAGSTASAAPGASPVASPAASAATAPGASPILPEAAFAAIAPGASPILSGAASATPASSAAASATPAATPTPSTAASAGAVPSSPAGLLGADLGPATPEQRPRLLEELRALQRRLAELQGEAPLILPAVDEQAVASVVADWTGIPVGRMVRDEIAAVLRLADTLGERVLGQGHGLDMIARRIQTSRARLDNPGKPIGVFMLCGPSGVGKTETALALAEALYGGEQNLITINMSEFQEAHTVSTLKGAPPGYVGYGEGGVLTEAVRHRPYSVVLLDEIEKAHPDVHEIFFQVFDKGWMEDAEGRHIDFRNTIVLLTTNVGSDEITAACRRAERLPDPQALASTLRAPLRRVFPAALLGRLVTIPYYPLSDQMLADIVRLQLGRIGRRIAEQHAVPFEYEDTAVTLIVSRCTEVESGARTADAILTNTVLPRISTEYLQRLAEGRGLRRIGLKAAGGELVYEFE